MDSESLAQVGTSYMSMLLYLQKIVSFRHSPAAVVASDLHLS